MLYQQLLIIPSATFDGNDEISILAVIINMLKMYTSLNFVLMP